MAVSKRLRFEILRRDNHQCRYCGRVAPDVTLTVDHVVPVALGGGDDPSNLVAACKDCNAGKSSVPADSTIVDDVSADAMRWARAMEMAAEERVVARSHAADLHAAFKKEWDNWTNKQGATCPRPHAWRETVDQLIRAGLDIEDLVELVKVAMESPAYDTWRYWCGCCWKRLKKMQERAAEIVANDGALDLQPLMVTAWTAEELSEYEQDARDRSLRSFSTETLVRISAEHPCRHGVSDHCGDPVCRMEHATCLHLISGEAERATVRTEAVIAEAEALLDG
jgi:hypothetical protein